MTYKVERAAVIGAGIMGAGIAAHLANVGIPTLLLDIVPPDARAATTARRAPHRRHRHRAPLKARPAPAFYAPRSAARLITVGNIEDDLPKLAERRSDCRGRLRAAGRQARPLQQDRAGAPARHHHQLQYLRPSRAACCWRAAATTFRRHFLITHFFNPVRFLKLLELVPGADSDPAMMAFMSSLALSGSARASSCCKDTPNFIGNRIGIYGFMATLSSAHSTRATPSRRWTPSSDRPSVAPNPPSSAPPTSPASTPCCTSPTTSTRTCPTTPQRELFRMPDFVREMVKRGWTGEKGGQGFYKRVKDAGGASEILVIDPQTLEYRPQEKVRFPSIGGARDRRPTSASARASSSPAMTAPAQLAWEVTADSLIYSAAVPKRSPTTSSTSTRHALGLQLGIRPLRELGRAGRAWPRRPHAARGPPTAAAGRGRPGNAGKRFYRAPTGQQLLRLHHQTYRHDRRRSARAAGPCSRSWQTVAENGSATLID